MPFFIDRLHEHFEKRGDWIENGWRRDPQRIPRGRQHLDDCEPEEPILPGVIDVLGDDFIMFASDYPHWDGEWPESTKHLRTRPDISEADPRQDRRRKRSAFLHAQLSETEIDDAADDFAVEQVVVAVVDVVEPVASGDHLVELQLA